MNNGRMALLKPVIIRSAAIIVAYLVLEFIGLRQYTSILSGTPPTIDSSLAEAAGLALLYLAFYLGAYLLVPVYFISGLLQALLWRGKA